MQVKGEDKILTQFYLLFQFIQRFQEAEEKKFETTGAIGKEFESFEL